MSASTVILNGLTTHDYGTYYPYFAIRNDSGGVVYASTTDPECTPDTEGVVSIANGDGYIAANTDNDNTCLYLSGTGKVTVIAQHDKIFPFKSSQGGGDSGTASGSVMGLQIEKYIDETGSACVSVSTLPYVFYNGSAVVLNNEIHILGGGGGNTNHYKFNGSSWESVSTLPYNFYESSAVVLNNEIHILGSSYSNSTRTNHYKFNGSSWESVSTLPYNFYESSAVVLNNEIHILGGGGGNTNHYKFNGSSWESVSTLPYVFYNGSAVVLNNEIHILGGSGGITKHYAIKNNVRHIAAMLPKGTHIMLSDNEDINYASNATKVSNNIAEVTETGYVEVLAALPEPDNIKGYLTFY